MSARPPSSPDRAASRLQQILRGPSSTRTSSVGEFEAALLQAWRAEAPRALRRVRQHLTEAQLASIEALRRRAAAARRAGEVEGFLLQVFQALPEPVLLQTGYALIWNRAFSEHLQREQREHHALRRRHRDSVLRRFTLLMERGRHLGARRVLVPLGARVWRARVFPIPEQHAVALYLTGVRATLEDLPPNACTIALYKASGLGHKEIALLCDRSKSHVDKISAEHRHAFQALRTFLCRVLDR